MMGMFLAALDQTIVASAIRTIGDDLHGLSAQAWVSTAYLIASTISAPVYGKLSDIYGRKQFFLAAITIFVIGSVLCSFSTSMYMLAGFRAVQGLGAGGLFSLALAIIGDIVPPRARARYQSYLLSIFGAASVLGPVIGGFFAGADEILGVAGWRWVFLVNVPTGAVALLVVAKVLRLRHTRREHRVDGWGMLTICVCLVPLLTVAEQGRSWGWTDRRSLICYVVAAAGLVSFLVVESLMKQDALIPLRFFRIRTFSLTAIAGFLVGMGTIGCISLLPLYLQIVRGATPAEAGLQMIPATGGIIVGSLFAGQLISRTGKYKIFPVIGTALLVVALLLLHTVGVDTPYSRIAIFMGLFGFGMGLVQQPIMLAVQNAMSPRDIGVATSSVTFFRQMGATTGIAIFLSILFSTVGDKIAVAYQAAARTREFNQALTDPSIAKDPANRSILAMLHGVNGSALDDTSFLAKAAPVLARPFKDGFSTSMDMIFIIAAAAVAVAFCVLQFLPQIPLQTMSAVSAMAARGGARPSEAASRGAHSAATDGVHRPSSLADLDRTRTPVSNEAVLTGHVEGPGGVRVSRATLTVTDCRGAQVARAATGDDGAYRLIVPTGGTFLFICAAHNLQPAATMITVSAGKVRRDVSLAGTNRVTGMVTDPTGVPIPDATLTLVDVRGEVVGTAVTGPDGRYAMADLYPAEYTLTAAAAGARPNVRIVVLDTVGVNTVDIVLAINGMLAGIVRAAASGTPVPDASVLAIDSSGMVAGATLTDLDGRYELTDLSPGVYTVTASGYAPVSSRVEMAGRRTDHDFLLGRAPHEGRHRMHTVSPVADAPPYVVGTPNSANGGHR